MEKVAGDEHNLRYLYQMMKPHHKFDAPFVRRYWGMQYRSQVRVSYAEKFRSKVAAWPKDYYKIH